MEAPPKTVLVSRLVAATMCEEAMYNGLLRAFGKQHGQHFSPLNGDTQVLYCPYALFEELKEKFAFLQRDEKFLYNLILSLPFETDKEELEQNLRELIRLDFKQLENLRELLSKLNKQKELWSRCFLL